MQASLAAYLQQLYPVAIGVGDHGDSHAGTDVGRWYRHFIACRCTLLGGLLEIVDGNSEIAEAGGEKGANIAWTFIAFGILMIGIRIGYKLLPFYGQTQVIRYGIGIVGIICLFIG